MYKQFYTHLVSADSYVLIAFIMMEKNAIAFCLPAISLTGFGSTITITSKTS